MLRRLRESLRNNPDTWEHQDLDSFLEALAAWTHDMDGYFRRDGQPVPDQPTWDLLAQMVLAARVYE
ncbi:MAG: hypothetical protein HYX51_11035 [Chloroflexi bacterium]|nr:hypothetical protein [Chloroflexota bacterium]